MNVIQCIQILLEEMTGSLDTSLNNTAARLKELKPDQDKDQAKLWEYRDNILAIWEEQAIQVRHLSARNAIKHFVLFVISRKLLNGETSSTSRTVAGKKSEIELY